jgi:hypothetical protein
MVSSLGVMAFFASGAVGFAATRSEKSLGSSSEYTWLIAETT